jgi:hypothetical protein
VLERVGALDPGIHEALEAFPHDQVEVLIRLAGHDAIVVHALLIIGKSAPTIAMQSVEKRQTSPVKTRAQIYGILTRQWNNLNSNDGRGG